MKKRSTELAALLLTLGLAPLAFGQGTDPTVAEEIEALKKGQEEIKKELLELKRLVQQSARPAPPPPPAAPSVEGKEFSLGDNPVKGADTARLTLIEFMDFQ